MLHRLFISACIFATLLPVCAPAATPPLLDAAVNNWNGGRDDLAFTLNAKMLNDDGSVKETRVERYDPSLPDKERWRLLEVNGKPPTDDQRERIEAKRNRKPRKRAMKPLGEYFDFENAKTLGETGEVVRYLVAVRPEAARLVAVEKLDVEVAVNKQTKLVERISAGLNAPMRVAFGVAKVTDVDLDLHFDPVDEDKKPETVDVQATGTAKVTMSKLGNRAEYTWGDFKRVTRYQGPAATTAASP